jgi:hypothetical protein
VLNDALAVITDNAVCCEVYDMMLDGGCYDPTADLYTKEVSRQCICFLVYGALLQTYLSDIVACV